MTVSIARLEFYLMNYNDNAFVRVKYYFQTVTSPGDFPRHKQWSEQMDKSNETTPKQIEDILKNAKTVAVVGMSDKPHRASYRVADYLKKHGYRIIPVNPRLEEALGEKAYGCLDEISEKVDIVDIFRKTEAIPDVVDKAIEIKAGTVWMQLELVHEAAASKAREAGLNVVMDRCVKIEHEIRRG